MTLSFSQRIGAAPIPEVPSVDSANESLRKRVWNALDRRYFQFYRYRENPPSAAKQMIHFLWVDYFNFCRDEKPYHNYETLKIIKSNLFKCSWHEFFSLIEAICTQEVDSDLIEELNSIFEREYSAYRIIEGQVSQIHSPIEVDEISSAMNSSIQSVQSHLN